MEIGENHSSLNELAIREVFKLWEYTSALYTDYMLLQPHLSFIFLCSTGPIDASEDRLCMRGTDIEDNLSARSQDPHFISQLRPIRFEHLQ